VEMTIKTGGDAGGVHFLHVLSHGSPVPRLRGILKEQCRKIQDLLFFFETILAFQKIFSPFFVFLTKCLILRIASS
jgi:hypothetical protein